MALAIVLCFLGGKFIVLDSIQAHRSKVMPPLGHLPAAQLWEETEGVAAEDLPGIIENYSEKLQAPVELVVRGQREWPEPVAARLATGDVGWSGDPESVSLYIPLRDDVHVAVIGPVEGFFDPHPTDVAKSIALVLAVVTVFTTLPMIPLVRRLRRLDRAARAIGEGSLDARVPVGPPNTLGKLERHFNLMADRVEELLAGQRQLVQAVAHEIRTPIARIEFGLEMVELAEDAEEKQRRQADLHAELEELDRLVGELLVFSRYDVGTAELATEDVDVADAVQQQVSRDTDRYPEIQVEIAGLDEAGAAHVHARSFGRVVHNLVSNALRYARSQVRVGISKGAAGELVITVDDDGPGIPADERERILEPFGRTGDSRDRSTGGVGLGLAIVRRIVEAHGGTVRVGDSPAGGAQFVTTWPR